MNVLKKLAGSIREYKAASIITPIAVALEVVVECLIPLVMADFIDALNGIETAAISDFIVKYPATFLLVNMGQGQKQQNTGKSQVST